MNQDSANASLRSNELTILRVMIPSLVRENAMFDERSDRNMPPSSYDDERAVATPGWRTLLVICGLICIATLLVVADERHHLVSTQDRAGSSRP